MTHPPKTPLKGHEFDRTADSKRAYMDWLVGRARFVLDLAEALPPWRLYRLVTTNRLVTIYSYLRGRDARSPRHLRLQPDRVRPPRARRPVAQSRMGGAPGKGTPIGCLHHGLRRFIERKDMA